MDKKEYHRKKSNEWYKHHKDNPESVLKRRQYKQNRHRERKKELIGICGGSCIECGYSEHPAALDFHHRDPSQKKFSVGTQLVGKPMVDLLEETAKCDLLCSNCHRVHHWNERAL